MMMRLLFWLALAVLVVFAIRAKVRAAAAQAQAQAQARAQGASARTARAEIAETMTSCAHCGLYFPASEAVHANGLDYCSTAHARLPPPASPPTST